ncbi:MAG: hypothetical protein LH478_14425 [Chitinophagaceae bacterium]|nr:hypothetical protein [Chitinophagaceae bacterium]
MLENNIELPPFIIAELFKNSLVEVNEDNYVSSIKDVLIPLLINDQLTEVVVNEQIYLGNNLKQVSIVVSEADKKIINEKDLKFLTSILKACQLNKEDIAIFNQLKTPVTYSYLKENLQAKYLLVFGIEPTEIKLPFIIPHFQVQQYAGCTIIIAPPLSDMNNDNAEGKLLKTKLWMSLQRCFNLKQQSKK